MVEDLWDSDESLYGLKEQRKDYVEKALDGLNYLYKFPDQVVSAIHCTGILAN